MIGIVLFIVAVLLSGATIGAIVVIAVGIRREERSLTLTARTTDKVCLGARQLTGLHVRGHEVPGDRSEHSDPRAVIR